MAKREEQKETRTKTWTIVLYPESAEPNWRTIIDDMHIEWACSPLHDRDVDATGELKKSHWHILLVFGSIKAFDQVKELTDRLKGPIPQRCHNARAMVRYLAHLDNPDKAQYNVADIEAHGGIDVSELLRPSSSERYTIIKEMMAYIKSNNIIEFQDIADYASENEYDRWFPALCDSSSIVIREYIKSQRHRPRGISIDTETGEII